MATPGEINRAPFVFRDTLFVDLGVGKRHARASDAELRLLLLPNTKSTAAASANAKDQVAHYYEAQLLHYGLQRTKDKNLAKVRLTKALSEAGKPGLQVPADVKALEADMKKEWAKEVRKAAKGEKVGPSAAKKRKTVDVDDDDGRNSPSFKARVTVDIDVPGYAAPKAKAPPKKVKTETAPKIATTKAKTEPVTTKTKPTPSPAAVKKNKATTIATRGASTSARGGKNAAPSSRSSAATGPASSPASPKPRMKQTARRSAPFMASSLSYRPQHTPVFSNEHSDVSMMDYDDDDDDDDDDDNAPPPYDSHDFDQHNSPSTPRPEKHRGPTQITGNYDITATIQGSEVTPSFAIRLNHPAADLWGSINIPGRHLCILHGPDIDALLHDGAGTVHVAWRAEDRGTGQCLFRRENRGHVSFDGEGGVTGTVLGLCEGGDLEFEGELTHGFDLPDVEELRGEWDAIPRRAYGRR